MAGVTGCGAVLASGMGCTFTPNVRGTSTLSGGAGHTPRRVRMKSWFAPSSFHFVGTLPEVLECNGRICLNAGLIIARFSNSLGKRERG